MFPWVCLATMPLFYPFDWPKILPIKLVKLKSKMCKQVTDLNKSNNEQEQRYETKDMRFNDAVDQGIEDIKDINNSDINKVNDETEIFFKTDEDYAKHSPKWIDKEILEKNIEQEPLQLTTSNDKETGEKKQKNSCKQRVTVFLILLYVLSQAFLPFSHFITQVRDVTHPTNTTFGTITS